MSWLASAKVRIGMARTRSQVRVDVIYRRPVGNSIPVFPLSSVVKVNH